MLEGHRSAELLVHAMAQLPDIVTAELSVHAADLEQLDLLARAYGMRDRLHFVLDNAGMSDRHTTSELVAELLRNDPTLGELVESLSRRDDPPTQRRSDDTTLSGHRIAIITNFPSHYRVPLFAKIAARLVDVGGAMRVFFLAAEAAGRPWLAADILNEFDFEILRSREFPLRERSPLVPIGLERRLAHFSPTVILVGGFSPLVAGRVGFFARRRRIAWGVWSGETPRMGTARSRVRARQRKVLLDRATFAVAYGAESAAYLRALKPDLPIVIGRNTSPVSTAVQASPARRGSYSGRSDD
jgi:hypothetical protein